MPRLPSFGGSNDEKDGEAAAKEADSSAQPPAIKPPVLSSAEQVEGEENE